jgi:signal transduction histidine kinase/CheY-like chemotaxis protein
MALWSRWIDQRLPPSLEEEARPRARFFVVTVLFGVSMISLSALFAFLSGLSVLGALNVLGAGACFVTLRLFMRDPHSASVVRGFSWFLVLYFPLGALATSPMELTMLGYLFLVPLIAATMLDRGEARSWFFRAMLAGIAATVAGHLGLVAPQVDPFPMANRVINFGATLIASMGLLDALGHESERSMLRLREAERAKSAFFANVGHEIRTPMNGVMGMTDALLGRELGPDEREMAQIIRSSGQLMLALIDDLLDLSKLEAGRLVLQEEVFPLADFTHAVRATWAPLASAKQLQLSVALEPSLPAAVKLDQLRLRQVLGNLLSNALKFTERGGVSLRLWAEGERLCCAVDDTGIGISPEQQRRLFGRFVQADEALARRYQGSGLGLALSRELVVHMGGSLDVESELGGGSRFICRLPLVPGTLPRPPQPEPARALRPGLRVLVVDDNAVNRLVAQRLLERNQCVVEAATDGPSALEVLGREAFDVVLMDVHMPGMDGLEVTRRIREGARAPGVRIIGVSASAAAEDVRGCREAGMNDFLAKPMTHDRLLATLLAVVDAAP